MAFKKGESGNPGGRPKENEVVKKLARQHGPAAVSKLAKLMDSEDERVSVAACQAILDRGYGKPAQTVDMNINDERPTRDSLFAELAQLHARLAERGDGRGTEPNPGPVPGDSTTH